jgi:alpha-tubulin suppressor-like RCC1 family protein
MPIHRALLPLVAAAVLSACSHDGTDATDSGEVARSITLRLDTLDYGATVPIDVVVKDQNGAPMTDELHGPISVESSNVDVARINFEVMSVTGTGIGEATITARYGGLETSVVLPVRLGFAPPTMLTAGAYHTCVVDTAGAAWCWGRGEYGVLGNGAEENSATPVPVAGGHSFTSITAGYYHTCGIADDGVWCWGYGGAGQLGSDTTLSSTPVKVQGGLEFVRLAAGDGHTCGLQADGTAYCWGYGANGQLGRTTIAYYAPTPEKVAGDVKFAQISANALHTCALTRLGKAYCWGEGRWGALGTGDEGDRTAPVAVLDTLSFVQIGGGSGHTCGLVPARGTFCWGYNAHGELGAGTAGDQQLSPVRVNTTERFSALSQGRASHLCGIDAGDAKVRCWGYNEFGQIGNSSTNDALTPSITGTLTARAVVAGYNHSCAVDTSNRIFCWGYNYEGQVGTGTVGELTIVASPSEVTNSPKM